jgi:hypothetical protein
MKSIIYKVILMSLLMASAVTTTKANAQTRIDVPFSFNIGNVSYLSGTYLINRVSLMAFVSLENNDGQEIARWGLCPGAPAPTDTRISMFFDEANNNHILRAVQYHALITPRLDGYSPRNQHGNSLSHEGN